MLGEIAGNSIARVSTSHRALRLEGESARQDVEWSTGYALIVIIVIYFN
jgi:L-lactate permease